MKYSFIVPTYNSQKWIRQNIGSVLKQTNDKFEIIILDDCSTDGTVEWLRSLNDNRITIYPSEKRLGIVENWARILTVPKKQFMTILGHDDVLYPDYLSVIDDLIKKHPEASVYQTHFNFIDEKGDIIRSCAAMENKILPERFLADVLKNKIEITGTGFMMRSTDYDRVGGIPGYPNLLYADIELMMELVRMNYLAVAMEKTFEFRFHIHNTSKAGGEKRLQAFEKLILYLKKLETEDSKYKQVIQDNVEYFLNSYVVGACHKLLYIGRQNREGITFSRIVNDAKKAAFILAPALTFDPDKLKGIVLAKLIDSNAVTRRLFLFIKSFKKRTF